MDNTARRLGLYFALGGLLVVVDTVVTVFAMPSLIREFDTDLSAVQWVTTGYVLALVAAMPTAAWAVGRLGARRVYLLALALFTVGSLLAGCAWDVGSLVGFRVLQGLGGGLLNPVSMAIGLAAVPPEKRGHMMSLTGLPILFGPIAAPLLGGVLLDQASWRWIFWINVPLGAVALVLGRVLLPRTVAPAPPRLDVIGLLLLSPGVTLTVLGLTAAGHRATLAAAEVLLPLLAGIVLVAVFLRHAARSPAPLLRVAVVRHRAMGAGVATVALFAAAYFGSMVLAPAYVQVVRGDSATLAGLIAIPQGLATGIAVQIATRLVDRIQPRRVVGAGIATAFTGVVLTALVLRSDLPYGWYMALGALTGLGVGATILPAMTAATRPLLGPDLPSATTLLVITSQTAVATGTALQAATLAWAGGGTFTVGAIRLTMIVPAVLMGAAWCATRLLPREATAQPQLARPQLARPAADRPG